MSEKFTWIDFYEEFAKKMLGFKDSKETLIKKVADAYESMNLDNNPLKFKDPKTKEIKYISNVDPFTIFSMFNRG